jgi:hypothetical protein
MILMLANRGLHQRHYLDTHIGTRRQMVLISLLMPCLAALGLYSAFLILISATWKQISTFVAIAAGIALLLSNYNARLYISSHYGTLIASVFFVVLAIYVIYKIRVMQNIKKLNWPAPKTGREFRIFCRNYFKFNGWKVTATPYQAPFNFNITKEKKSFWIYCVPTSNSIHEVDIQDIVRLSVNTPKNRLFIVTREALPVRINELLEQKQIPQLHFSKLRSLES